MGTTLCGSFFYCSHRIEENPLHLSKTDNLVGVLNRTKMKDQPITYTNEQLQKRQWKGREVTEIGVTLLSRKNATQNTQKLVQTPDVVEIALTDYRAQS